MRLSFKRKQNYYLKLKAMTTYFPYSEIINEICNHIEQTISRAAYTGDWQVTDQEPADIRRPSYAPFSELYY